VLGLVGESGSGKSVSMMALMGLIDPPGQVRPRRWNSWAATCWACARASAGR
jgi:ABC-type dipeptide/oligopeptide/nickel transport system ATPase component